jgi:hypothetical protein
MFYAATAWIRLLWRGAKCQVFETSVDVCSMLLVPLLKSSAGIMGWVGEARYKPRLYMVGCLWMNFAETRQALYVTLFNASCNLILRARGTGCVERKTSSKVV